MFKNSKKRHSKDTDSLSELAFVPAQKHVYSVINKGCSKLAPKFNKEQENSYNKHHCV